MNIVLSYFRELIWPNKLIAVIRHYKINKLYKCKNVNIGINTNVHKCHICRYVWIGRGCSIVNSTIERHTYIGGGTSINNATIGAFCSISFNVSIGLGKHPSQMVSTHPSFYSKNKPFTVFADKDYYDEYGTVSIGNDVLIGKNAVISYGVTIGDGAIVTNNAVVTKNVPPYAIVGGVPAKLIKYRFDENTINRIRATKWWEWDESLLRKNYTDFIDVSLFCKKYCSKQ